MKVSFNFQNSIIPVNFRANNTTSNPITNLNTPKDEFVRVDQKEFYLKKLDELFSSAGGINAVYENMCKDFNIDYPPKLNLYSGKDNITSGGFTFNTNEIGMCLEEMLGYNYKLVGIKNGKKTTIISPNGNIPLFADKASLDMIAKLHSTRGNLGFDSLSVEQVTDNDLRHFVVQKISHEIIHAQQHMVLRQTEGIGSKEIIKAWTHIKPKDKFEEMKLQRLTEDLYNKSYWKNVDEGAPKYPKNSSVGQLARIWLDAIKNYPAVDSPEYMKNAIEQDAYKRSFEYANKYYGNY